MPDNNGREGVVIEAIKYIVFFFFLQGVPTHI